MVIVSKYLISVRNPCEQCIETIPRRTLTVQQHFIAHQCLLEGRAHESVAGSRFDQDSKVDVEDGEIYYQGHDNKAYSSSIEVSPELFLYSMRSTVIDVMSEIP